MSTPIRILFVHGIGFQEEDKRWQLQWQDAARDSIRAASPEANVEAWFFDYDRLFKDNNAPDGAMVVHTTEMLASWAAGKIGGLFGRSRGMIDDMTHAWEARPGMVAEWAGDKKLRAALRARLEDAVLRIEPHVIAAHSLGSLLSYDWLRGVKDPDLIGKLKNISYLTFGCQISNPALSPVFDGQVLMPPVRQWINLWNRQDRIFVDSIRVNADGFVQVNLDREYGHDGSGYLGDPITKATAWNQIALSYSPSARLSGAVTRGLRARAATPTRPETARKPVKALLIGINEYADPSDNLEGCVNDVFRMSAVLQECGVDADHIRIVLNDRATASGIRERIDWLLDDAREDDQRVLFYSGHGAQMPSYGGDDIPEDVDECLVPHDFAWTEDSAIIDDWFFEAYRNLPYTVRFNVILDCCHSGGMARHGGARVRGIDPPDDIRHRAMRWDSGLEMWVPRDQFKISGPVSADFAGKMTSVRTTRALGSGRIGRLPKAKKPQGMPSGVIDASKPYGPFQPVLIKACAKDEVAMEYRDGAQSFGAFTYCLTQLLRKKRNAAPSFADLVRATQDKLKRIGYKQNPGIEGPSARLNETIPWHGQAARSAGRKQ